MRASFSDPTGPPIAARLTLPSLTIFFPCYNEEGAVESVTRQAVDVGRQITDDLEVIVVDDGSVDRTGEIADRMAAEFPEVRVVHNRPNKGYGGALQTGFTEARKEWVFYTDGDGQFDLQHLPQMLSLLDQAQVISCYRLDRKDRWMRKFNSYCWGVCINLVLRVGLRDIDCAFKLYPRAFLDQIQIRSQTALVDAEMLSKARALGFSIAQRGVPHQPRTTGVSTCADLRFAFRVFKELFALYLPIRRDCREYRRGGGGG